VARSVLAELAVNGELLVKLPLGTLIGQQAGNMAEIFVGALLLRRFIGPRAALDRAEQVSGMVAALGIATALSATVGTTSMLVGGIIEASDAPTFCARGGSATRPEPWSWCPWRSPGSRSAPLSGGVCARGRAL
jgi:hypothetical protein